MTKDQLREALVAHGVDPPPVNARKAEYIAVYRAQISDLGLFSSDDDEDEDDDEMQAKTASPKKLNSTAATKSAQVGLDTPQIGSVLKFRIRKALWSYRKFAFWFRSDQNFCPSEFHHM